VDIRGLLPGIPLPTFERRATPRISVELGVEFQRVTEQSEEQRRGITADISAGGVRFRTASWRDLQTGEEIRLRISGTSAKGRGPLMHTLHATGRISRIDAAQASTGDEMEVAVQFSRGPCFQVYRWCT